MVYKSRWEFYRDTRVWVMVCLLHSGMWQTVWIPTVAPAVKNALKLQASIPGSALGSSTLHTTSSTVSQASKQEHRTLAPAMNNVLKVRRARLQRQNPHISGLPAIFIRTGCAFGVQEFGVSGLVMHLCAKKTWKWNGSVAGCKNSTSSVSASKSLSMSWLQV